MKANFEYEQTTKIYFGRGKAVQLPQIAASYGKRILLVTGRKSSSSQKLYEKILADLRQEGIYAVHYDGVGQNPTTEQVDAGTEIARKEQVEAVIGVGGGSVLDSAKAIAMAAVNPGKAWDYLFYKTPQPTKTLPVIAVTTTSGTGSQVTQVAVITETRTKTKSAVFNNLIYPKAAIVDPELVQSLPEHITASTGFDAFCHCFESYLHINASPYTDLVALEGIRMTAKYLERAVKDGNDLEAREGMAWADTCGGLAIANAGTTLPHGIGMTISGHCPSIMHGEALALCYPSFTRLTCKAAQEKFSAVGRILNPGLWQVSQEEAAEQCCDEIDKLLKKIGMWMNFKSFGVDKEMLKTIALRSHDLPDYRSNPVIADTEEIYRELLEAYNRT